MLLAHLPTLWAVHLADAALTNVGWVIGGFSVMFLLMVRGAWRVRDEEIPRIGLLTAAFFVASAIMVPVGPTHVHLLLNGLLGVILGWRAALAIPVGLFLQALLLGHGGFTSLGVNCVDMTVPALLAGQLFRVGYRQTWIGQPWCRAV